MSSLVTINKPLTTYAALPTGETRVPSIAITCLSNLCDQLVRTFNSNTAPYSAWQFEPVLRAFSLEEFDRRALLGSPFGKYALINNTMMKVVLIHWDREETTSVHGHPAGGCMFKILHGSLVERRFNPAERERVISTHVYRSGALAYIDDTIALHDVSNRSSAGAISLHAYTPGTVPRGGERKERKP